MFTLGIVFGLFKGFSWTKKGILWKNKCGIFKVFHWKRKYERVFELLLGENKVESRRRHSYQHIARRKN